MKKVFWGMFTIKQLSKSNLGHFQYKTIFKKHFRAFSVSNNFQGDISWPDAAGEAATLSGGSHWWFAITNCKLQEGVICKNICKLKRKQEYQIIMNRIIESDRLLDGSSDHRLQNLVTLIFQKKMEILVIVMFAQFLGDSADNGFLKKILELCWLLQLQYLMWRKSRPDNIKVLWLPPFGRYILL